MKETDLLTILRAAERIDRGEWLMRCPAHRGAWSSSLELRLDAGRYTLRCMAGCSVDAVLQAALRKLGAEARIDV